MLGDVEADVRERFERIEAILETVARRQDRFDKQLQYLLCPAPPRVAGR